MRSSIVDLTAVDASATFVRVLETRGFAVLVGHPVRSADLSALVDEWLAFFATETKHAYAGAGYFAVADRCDNRGRALDHKEFFHVRSDGVLPHEVSGRALDHFGTVCDLAEKLLSWLVSPAVPAGPGTVLRIQHFLPLPGVVLPGTVRALAHTDINLLTVLAAPSAGLQIEDLDGVWHDVTCAPGSLVINAGEMLTALSRGRYRAVNHRVIVPSSADGARSRMSLPLFVHAPEELVVTADGETAAAFLRRRTAALRHRGFRPVPRA